MKNPFLPVLALAGLLLAAAPSLRAQGGAFAIKNITPTTPKTPEYNTQAGDATTRKYTLGSWLSVEVEFASAVPAPEVNFHYSILISGQMLVGDQTLVDVPAGQSLFTVVFVSPKKLTALLRGAPLTPNAIQNIDVQILRPGVSQPVANKMLKEGAPFYTTMQQIPGFVLNKAQTPFAPLWYDRYETVKDAATGGR